MKKKIVIFLATLMIFMIGFALMSCNGQDDKNQEIYYKTPKFADTIYVIKAQDMTKAERIMIYSLEGILAQTEAAIFVEELDGEEDNHEIKMWLDDAADRYSLNIEYKSDPWELVELFKDRLSDNRYVLYTSSDNNIYDQSINYATTISGAERFLMIEKSLETKAVSAGLTIGKDATSLDTESVFNEYKDSLTKTFLVHQKPTMEQLRDYAIAGKAFCWYSDFETNTDISYQILQWADKNAPIFGWTENETNYVLTNSLTSKITIPSDWSSNLSFFSAADCSGKSIQQQNVADAEVKAESGKHYLAIVMSDGDNIQWIQRNFLSSKKYFGNRYRGDFKMTWGISPSLYDLAPNMMYKLYEEATENDLFISGPGGAGYVNISEYSRDSLSDYAEITANYMQNLDLEYINFIDAEVDAEALDAFASFDQIRGGIWSVGDKYIEGGGGIYWSNDKPFITARETLWNISGDANSNKYYGYIERVAQRINSYKKDPTIAEGYTVLVAHAWSLGNMDAITRFVDLLDENVELVTVGEMVELVKQNVPHENVTELDDLNLSDFEDRLCEVSSEQLRYKELREAAVSSRRIFRFNDIRDAEEWNMYYGSGDLDKADFRDSFVLLDGSDFGDLNEQFPNAWMWNKFLLTSDDKYFHLWATSDRNANLRVRILYEENGTMVSDVLNSGDYTQPTDENGYYLLSTGDTGKFTYDLEKYLGKTVVVAIEQDDNGEGDGETVKVYQAFFDDNEAFTDLPYPDEQYEFEDLQNAPISEKREWAGNDLQDWYGGFGSKKYDDVAWLPAGEGNKPVIRFEGSDLGNLNDYVPNSWIYTKVQLTENDSWLHLTLLSAKDADTGFRVRIICLDSGTIQATSLRTDSSDREPDSYGYYVIDRDCDENFYFDLSAFAGKTIVISIEQDDNGEGSGEVLNLYEVGITSEKTN